MTAKSLMPVEMLELGEWFNDGGPFTGERIHGGTVTAAGKFVAVRYANGCPAYLPHGLLVTKVIP